MARHDIVIDEASQTQLHGRSLSPHCLVLRASSHIWSANTENISPIFFFEGERLGFELVMNSFGHLARVFRQANRGPGLRQPWKLERIFEMLSFLAVLGSVFTAPYSEMRGEGGIYHSNNSPFLSQYQKLRQRTAMWYEHVSTACSSLPELELHLSKERAELNSA